MFQSGASSIKILTKCVADNIIISSNVTYSHHDNFDIAENVLIWH